MRETKILRLVVMFWIAFVVISTTLIQAQTRFYAIQVASTETQNAAQSMVESLKAKGVDAYWVKAEINGIGTRYRVRTGKFGDRAVARSRAEKFLSEGLIKEYIVIKYDRPDAGSLRPDTSGVQQTQAEKPPVIEAPREKPAEQPVEAKKEVEKTAPLNQPVTVPEPKPVADDPGPRTDSPTKARNVIEAEAGIALPPMTGALTDPVSVDGKWKVSRRGTETDKNLRAVYFIDEMTGWVAGDAGTLYRTTDGGRSWKPMLCGVTADINFIFFIDWNNGWMLGEVDGNNPAMSEMGTLLLRTSDGGRTWSFKTLPDIQSLTFSDPRNGLAVGRNATVLKTGDGGENWEPVPGIEKLIGLPVESTSYNFGFTQIKMLDTRNAYMIGNFYGRMRNNVGGLFRSTDGGATWTRIPFTLKTRYSSGRFTPGLLHSIRFRDSDHGTLTGEMYDGEGRYFFVLQTSNGGRNWIQHETLSRSSHATIFPDNETGWTAAFAQREGNADAIAFDTTLMKTDNGGMSWQKELTASGRRIRNLHFLSSNKGWAVGDRGLILRYENK